MHKISLICFSLVVLCSASGDHEFKANSHLLAEQLNKQSEVSVNAILLATSATDISHLDAAAVEYIRSKTKQVAPKVEWVIGQGTDQGEYVFDGLQTKDGGFIAVGKTNERGGGSCHAIIIKTNGKGKLEWQRIVGGNGRHEEGRCIIESSTGYYLGGTFTQGGKTGAGIVKLDKKGMIVWTRVYPHARHGAIRGIDLAKDGIVVTGYTDYAEEEVPFIADEAKGFVMKTDFQGKPVWRRQLSVNQGTKVKVDVQNGGFVLCSTVWRSSKGSDQQDACLIKLDPKGRVEWQKTYGGSGNDQCFDMDLTDDGYVLAGHTTSFGKEGWDAWLVKVGLKGDLQWQKSFGQPLGGNPRQIFDECYGVKTIPDGGFVLACGSGIEPENVRNRKDPRNTWAAYLVRTDDKGNLLWEYSYHTPKEGHNAAEYIALCSDGGFLVFLDSDTAGEMGEENIGFLKLTSPKKEKRKNH
jgi:hypothetical protein